MSYDPENLPVGGNDAADYWCLGWDAPTPEPSVPSQLEHGLQVALDANHEFDVWQRVKKAVTESEDPCPEGLYEEDVYLSFLGKMSLGGDLIGRGTGGFMTDEGLQIDHAGQWQIMFALSDGPRSTSEATQPYPLSPVQQRCIIVDMSETILAFEELMPEVHDIDTQPNPEEVIELLDRHQQVRDNLAQTALQDSEPETQ